MLLIRGFQLAVAALAAAVATLAWHACSDDFLCTCWKVSSAPVSFSCRRRILFCHFICQSVKLSRIGMNLEIGFHATSHSRSLNERALSEQQVPVV